jgi:hypothetical protein
MVTADGTQSSAEQTPLSKTQAVAVIAYWSHIQQHGKIPVLNAVPISQNAGTN